MVILIRTAIVGVWDNVLVQSIEAFYIVVQIALLLLMLLLETSYIL